MSLLSDVLTKPWLKFAADYGMRITNAEYLQLRAIAESANTVSGGGVGSASAAGTLAVNVPVIVPPDTLTGVGTNIPDNPNKSWALGLGNAARIASNAKRAILIVDNQTNPGACTVGFGDPAGSETYITVQAGAYWEMPSPAWKGGVCVTNEYDEPGPYSVARVMEFSYT